MDTLKELERDVMVLLAKSNVVLPKGSTLWFSHHYGIERFREVGAAVINCIKREGYSKKYLVMLPGQRHPEHFHVHKDETFTVLYGDLVVNGEEPLERGQTMVMEPGKKHSFYTQFGCVFEEISSKEFENDSFYSNRKTLVREL